MDIRPVILKFLKFGVVGASGMVVDFAVLWLMRDVVGLGDILSNTISFAVAATCNYILNRIWTFRSHEQRVASEYVKFLAVSVVGLMINNGVLLLSRQFFPEAYAGTLCLSDFCVEQFYLFKLLAIAITTLWNFFGNMLFTFRQKP